MTKAKSLFFIPLVLLLVSCGGSKQVTQQKPAVLIEDETTRFRFEQAYLSGEQAKAIGNLDEALRHYAEAARIFPQSSGAHYALAELFNGQRRYQNAYNEIRLAIELEDGNVHFYDLQAQICHALSKHEEAGAAFQNIYRLQPNNVDAYFDAANQFIYAKNYKVALKIYDQMEKKFGVGEDLILQKEQLYLRLNQPEKAVNELKKLIDLAPDVTRYKGLLAELYWSMNKKKEAVALYQKILTKEPGNGMAHFGMAEYYRSENKKDEMLSSLVEAFKDPNINARNKVNVIFSLLPLIQSDPSMKPVIYKMAETIKEAHPAEAIGYSLMADFYMAENRKEDALKEYATSVELDPSNAMMWQQYLGLLAELSQYRELQIKSDKALELFPNQVMFYYFNVLANSQLKNHSEVVVSAKLGLGLYDENDDINEQLYLIMADSYHALENHEESDKAFEKALEIDPDDTYALNNYAYYLSLRKVNLEKAKEMSAKTLKSDPDNASYLDTYGWILYQMKDYVGAKEYIQKALLVSEGSPAVLEHMGDVYHQLKQPEEAKKYWQKALELSPDSELLKNKLNGKFTE